MRQIALLISLFLLIPSAIFSQEDIKKDIFDGLNQKDIEKLHNNFYTTIDLSIPGYENSQLYNFEIEAKII
jgi:hypothetical protein